MSKITLVTIMTSTWLKSPFSLPKFLDLGMCFTALSPMGLKGEKKNKISGKSRSQTVGERDVSQIAEIQIEQGEYM